MGGGELGTHNEAPPAPRRTRPHHRRHRRTTRPTDTPQYTASHRRDDSVAWCGGVVTTAKHASVQNESGTEEASPQVTLKARRDKGMVRQPPGFHRHTPAGSCPLPSFSKSARFRL